MKKIPRWLRIVLSIVMSLLGLIILAYVVENWRGARAWNETQMQLEKYGVARKFSELPTSVAVDDNLNFCRTPLLNGIEHPENESKREHLKGLTIVEEALRGTEEDPMNMPSKTDAFRQLRTDFSPWAEYLGVPAEQSAQRLFDAMNDQFGSELEELQSAASLPHASFGRDFSHIDSALDIAQEEYPHYTTAIWLARVLRTHGQAALAVGDYDVAFHDLCAILKLRDSMLHDPSLLSVMVAITVDALSAGLIWEGLALQGWNQEQLLDLESRVQSVDWVGEYREAMEYECLFNLSFIDLASAASGRATLYSNLESDDPMIDVFRILKLCPNGWLNQNRAFVAQSILEGSIIPCKERDWIQIATGLQTLASVELKHPYRFLGAFTLPVLTKTGTKVGVTHGRQQLAALACHLEAQLQIDSSYPDTIPPHYVDFDGQPLRYQTTSDGRYWVYSIGLNLKDDGGKFVPRSSTNGRIDWLKGDWVWTYSDQVLPNP